MELELEMTSDAESSDESEDSQSLFEDSSSWASLPDVCLTNVFRFLPDRDRARANRVCQHWYNVMHSPSLWRYRHFCFNGRMRKYRQSEHISAVGYARYLGMYLHRLDVTVYPPHSSVEALRLEQTISGLFRELIRVDTQLHSLSLRGLKLKPVFWKEDMVNTLFAFLHKGSSMLTSVTLTGTSISMQQGVELLSVLSSSQRSISHLDLQHFFDCGIPVHLNINMPQIMQQLRCLTDLTLDYSCLSNEMLTALSRNCLKNLSIQGCLTMPHRQVVNRDSWSILTSKRPELKVQITLDKIINTDHLARILQREIPLTDMVVLYTVEEEWSAKPLLFELLPQYSRRLQRLTLDLKNCSESLDVELLELVKACERLEHFELFAFLEVITVERILLLRLSMRPLLNNIRLWLYAVRSNLEDLSNQLENTMIPYSRLPDELTFSAVVHIF